MTTNPTKQSIPYLRTKADRLMQELGKHVYELCLVCGKPMDCLHHYYTKACSAALRYEWDNLIPICKGCHNRHHNGDPSIHNRINKVNGEKWLKCLEKKKKNTVKPSKKYYREIIAALEEALEKLS